MKILSWVLIVLGLIADLYFLGKLGKAGAEPNSVFVDPREAKPVIDQEGSLSQNDALVGLAAGSAFTIGGAFMLVTSRRPLRRTARRG